MFRPANTNRKRQRIRLTAGPVARRADVCQRLGGVRYSVPLQNCHAMNTYSCTVSLLKVGVALYVHESLINEDNPLAEDEVRRLSLSVILYIFGAGDAVGGPIFSITRRISIYFFETSRFAGGGSAEDEVRRLSLSAIVYISGAGEAVGGSIFFIAQLLISIQVQLYSWRGGEVQQVSPTKKDLFSRAFYQNL